MNSSVVEGIFKNAQVTPDKIAIIAPPIKITYKELYKLIRKFASILKDSGAVAGNYAILKVSHTIDFAVSYFACTMIGVIVIPVEKNLPPDGIREISNMTNAKIIIADDNNYEEKIIFYEFSSIISMCENDVVSAQLKCSFPKKELQAEVLFTTGTTGKSKGVQLSHEAIITVLKNIIYETHMKKTNIAFVPMPLNHVFGLRRFQANLLNGATVVIKDGIMPIKSFFKIIDQYGITSLSLVPSAISYVFTMSKDYIKNYAGQLEYVESSSAPLSSEIRIKLHEYLPNTALFNFYGCTESTSACVLEYSKYSDIIHCVGKPCISSKIYIIDSSEVRIEQTYKEGRIIIKSQANMSGYWQADFETSKVLKDGYVYTNDFGYWDDNGFLCVLGRIDDVINIGGNKVAPDEIENLTLKLTEILDCACIGMESKTNETVLKMFIVTDLGSDEAEKLILKYLKGKVEAYKIPSKIEKIERIPRTFNGKLQRNKLREL